MLLKNCIYFLVLVISLISIPVLIYSIKNKNGNICKNVKTIAIFYVIVLVLSIVVIPNVLSLDFGLEMLLLAFVALIAIIIYIISIIICSKKCKKSNESISYNKAFMFMLLFITLPLLLLFFSSFFKEYFLIINSDLILVYESKGNGGFGDSNKFAYAINENYCKEISLGVATGSYSLARYLPKKVTKIENVENIKNYNVLFNIKDRYITVYKYNKLIHKEKINENYFNVDFDGGFYINNN